MAGECTEEELIALRDILKNSPEEKQKLFKEEKLSDEFKAQFMPRTQLMLAEQRMQAKIREMKAEQQAEHHAHIIGMWRRAAAIAVVCVLGGLAWFYLQHNPISNMQMQVVMASADNDTTVTLPDGTKVWLNKLASIKYPKEFDGSDRKVEIDGEGYFEVTKNPHKPFIVESDVMSVKVLGRETRYFLTISATLKMMASSNSRRSRPVSFLIFSRR